MIGTKAPRRWARERPGASPASRRGQERSAWIRSDANSAGFVHAGHMIVLAITGIPRRRAGGNEVRRELGIEPEDPKAPFGRDAKRSLATAAHFASSAFCHFTQVTQ